MTKDEIEKEIKKLGLPAHQEAAVMFIAKQTYEAGAEEERERAKILMRDAIELYLSNVKNPFFLPSQDREYLAFEDAIHGIKERIDKAIAQAIENPKKENHDHISQN